MLENAGNAIYNAGAYTGNVIYNAGAYTGNAIYRAGAYTGNGLYQAACWLGHTVYHIGATCVETIVFVFSKYIIPAVSSFCTNYIFTQIGMGTILTCLGFYLNNQHHKNGSTRNFGLICAIGGVSLLTLSYLGLTISLAAAL